MATGSVLGFGIMGLSFPPSRMYVEQVSTGIWGCRGTYRDT